MLFFINFQLYHNARVGGSSPSSATKIFLIIQKWHTIIRPYGFNALDTLINMLGLESMYGI